MNRNDDKRPRKATQGDPGTSAGKKAAPKTGHQSERQPDRKPQKTAR